MGNLRRIRRQLGQPIAFAKKPIAAAMQPIAMTDAHVDVNGCRVFLAHPNKSKALSSAKGFKDMMAKIIFRASCPNVRDIYNAHFKVMKGLREKYDS